MIDGERPAGWVGLMTLVVITPAVFESGGAGRTGYLEVARAALEGGCRAIQMRDKELTDRDFVTAARKLKSLCRGYGALLFINDRVDVALVVGCDGVHLGDEDLDLEDARSIVPPRMIIGYSPAGLEDATEAEGKGADYLGVGPVFETPSKEDAGLPIGIDGIASYCMAAHVPVVGIGGINRENASSVLKGGASGVAVLSAVARASDIKGETARILKALERVGGI